MTLDCIASEICYFSDDESSVEDCFLLSESITAFMCWTEVMTYGRIAIPLRHSSPMHMMVASRLSSQLSKTASRNIMLQCSLDMTQLHMKHCTADYVRHEEEHHVNDD